MYQLECHRLVDAPLHTTWQIFTDLEKAQERIPAITKLEILGDGPVGVGTRFRETRVMFGKEATEEMEITEIEPESRHTVESDSCGAHHKCTYSFEAQGEQTRVHFDWQIEAVSFMAKVTSPMYKMMAKSMRKCIEQDMAALAEVAEAQREAPVETVG